jgi:hypothetical protein
VFVAGKNTVLTYRTSSITTSSFAFSRYHPDKCAQTLPSHDGYWQYPEELELSEYPSDEELELSEYPKLVLELESRLELELEPRLELEELYWKLDELLDIFS